MSEKQVKTEFVVKKPFKYFGVLQKQGETWKPQGGKYDKQIAGGPLVTRLETFEDKGQGSDT
jgi:hypothetical protein